MIAVIVITIITIVIIIMVVRVVQPTVTSSIISIRDGSRVPRSLSCAEILRGRKTYERRLSGLS